jgi:DNA-binding LytR/AlgR family response regulator
MLRIVLAEDSPSDARTIRGYCDRLCRERGMVAELLHFEDGGKLVEANLKDVDLYLLDIEMPVLDGLAVARAIRGAGSDAPICFVTNLGQLALEGYEVEAMGFLIKPIMFRSFAAMVDRAIARGERRRARLLRYQDGKVEKCVDLRTVSYAEAANKRVVMHVCRQDGGGELPCSSSLRAIEQGALLAGDGRSDFFRVHNAFLVNLGLVSSIGRDDAIVDGATIPVSRHRRRDFLQALASYVGR